MARRVGSRELDAGETCFRFSLLYFFSFSFFSYCRFVLFLYIAKRFL